MANAYPITAAQGIEIRKLRSEGLTWETIAIRLGRSRQGIVRYARRVLEIPAAEFKPAARPRNLTKENTSVKARQGSSVRHRSASPVDLNAGLASDLSAALVAPKPIGTCGAGSTTDQLIKAPRKAIYIWCNDKTSYPRRLANHLGRGDIVIVTRSWGVREERQGFRGLDKTLIVWDHAGGTR